MAVDLVEAASFGVIALVLIASGLASALVRRTFHSVMFLGVFLVSIAALYILLGSPLVGIIQILVYVGGILTLFVFAVMFVAGDEKEVVEETPQHAPRSRVWTVVAGFAVAAAVLYLAFTYVGTVNHLASGLLGAHWQDEKQAVWVASDLAMAVGFVAGTVFIVALAIGGLLAWLGIRHAIDAWSGTRIFGTLTAALLVGLLAALVLGFGLCGGRPCVNPDANWGDATATDTGVDHANNLDLLVGSLFSEHAIALEILGVLLTAVMVGALVLARPLGAPEDKDRYAPITPEQLRESQEVSDVSVHGPAPSAAASPATSPEVSP